MLYKAIQMIQNESDSNMTQIAFLNVENSHDCAYYMEILRLKVHSVLLALEQAGKPCTVDSAQQFSGWKTLSRSSILRHAFLHDAFIHSGLNNCSNHFKRFSAF